MGGLMPPSIVSVIPSLSVTLSGSPHLIRTQTYIKKWTVSSDWQRIRAAVRDLRLSWRFVEKARECTVCVPYPLFMKPLYPPSIPNLGCIHKSYSCPLFMESSENFWNAYSQTHPCFTPSSANWPKWVAAHFNMQWGGDHQANQAPPSLCVTVGSITSPCGTVIHVWYRHGQDSYSHKRRTTWCQDQELFSMPSECSCSH